MEAMVITDACPTCGSKRYKKNGHTRHGKQNHQCKACERQFGATADDHLISAAQRTMIERLLCERIALRGICRAVAPCMSSDHRESRPQGSPPCRTQGERAPVLEILVAPHAQRG